MFVAAVRGASEPESTEFRCPSGALVPFERTNDDYCDCPEDGADEPGTVGEEIFRIGSRVAELHLLQVRGRRCGLRERETVVRTALVRIPSV